MALGAMLTRRRLLAGTLATVAAPLAAEAQPTGKVYRVGFLHWGRGDVGGFEQQAQVFEQALRERGWVTGRIWSSRTASRRDCVYRRS